MLRLFVPLFALSMASCGLWKPTVRVIEKAATTTINVAGKAAGAGIDVAKDQYRRGRQP
ncbi:hypothetical protein N9062_00845 [Akkermansiaceae bacterium]|nr:hypothetical protein [Akkermansiaceae bacterium]MDF1711262.1 hypothetical protein [Akkermansiaceae bacterium]